MHPKVPDAFTHRMVQVLGSREALDRVLDTRSRPAVRVNPLKATRADVARRLRALGVTIEPVPFSKDAFFVSDPEARPLGSTWEHQAGLFFMQDAASTLPVTALDPQPGEAVLDLCAAPGGKATHIAERMGSEGLVVANEFNPNRLKHLVSNLDRIGAMNVVVTQANGVRRAWPVRFDRVLVDAPCSNLGGVHATWAPAFRFSQAAVSRHVHMQRGLLKAGFHACRPGGVIVYSTCTLEPRENEGVVSWFLDKYPVTLEPFDGGLKDVGGLTAVGDARYRDDVAGALRLNPGQVGTDGFFLARFRKLDDAPGAPEPMASLPETAFQVADAGELDAVRAQYALDAPELDGVHVTTPGKRYYVTNVPDLDVALSMGPKRLGTYLAAQEGGGWRLAFDAATRFGRHAERTHELSPAHARRWMAGEALDVDVPEWRVLTCRGEPVGCGRTFAGGGLKSFVPKERRVPVDGNLVGFLAA